MKINKLNLFLTIAGLLLCMNIFAQNVDLGKLSKEEREKYLTELAIEVTKTHGPDYYREGVKPVISGVRKYTTNDTRPEISKNIGREYYTVTFPCDIWKEKLEWNFTSKVHIWKDNGQPFIVSFGSGDGLTFMFTPYKKDAKNVRQVPFIQSAVMIELVEKKKKQEADTCETKAQTDSLHLNH